MASVKYIEPVAYISGKICRHSEVIFAHRKASGKNYTTQICNRRTSPYTTRENEVHSLFKQAQLNTTAALQDQTKAAAYKAQFKAQKKYSTLRGFVFAKEYKTLIDGE